MDERPACALCQRRCAAPFVNQGARAFCSACLVALGRLAADPRSRAKFWPVTREAGPQNVASLSRLVGDELKRTRPVPDAPRPTLESFVGELSASGPEGTSTEEVFAEFKERLQTVDAEDAQTHLDLAIAYRELGIPDDAVEEAAIALQHQDRLSRERAAVAVALLLEPRWLRLSVEDALVGLREALFTN